MVVPQRKFKETLDRSRRVTLFVTCLVDQFKPEIGDSVVRVLTRQGMHVNFPSEQTCCGQPAFNSGFVSDARSVAERFLDVFESEGPIVTPSGSCAAMVRNFYPELFHGDPVLLSKANAVAERLFEFSEFLVDTFGHELTGGHLKGVATYHKCCHLLRELGIRDQPLELMEAIDGLELRDHDKSEVCCGFGGLFSVKMPDISTAMLDEKLDNALACRADILVAGDAGCIMHMEGGLRRRAQSMSVKHIAELLDEAGLRSR